MSEEMQKPSDQAPLTARLFSAEMITWLISVVFIFGVGYSALASESKTTKVAVTEVRDAQKEVVEDISDIKASIAGIRATQRAADRRMQRQEKDIGRILDILQRENGNNH